MGPSDGTAASEPLAVVGLTLVDKSRSVSTAPRVSVGAVRFGGWQIHPITSAGPDFAGHDCYLVRVHYDLELGDGVLGLSSVEVGFVFETSEVTVADAIPRAVTEPRPAEQFWVTPQLGFAPVSGALPAGAGAHDRTRAGGVVGGDLPLPPLTPVIETFGIGGGDVRWRHRWNLPDHGSAGSHSGWLLVLVPTGCLELPVRAEIVYHLPPGADLRLRPRAEPAAFVVRLPVAPAVVTAESMSTAARQRPARRARTAVPGVTSVSENVLAAETSMRLGFTVDVVGYSTRSVPAQNDVQRRITELVDGLVSEDLDIELVETQRQVSGDGVVVFLPDCDVTRALPTLLSGVARRLALDNGRHADRVRLRLAADFGPVGNGAAGFTGPTVISFCRLVDSSPLRSAIEGAPGVDVVALISDYLHRSVVAPGYPGLDHTRFSPVRAVVKSYQADAWLWTGDPRAADGR